jgi:hypothetical protein
MIAEWFAELAPRLVIEWVPKQDAMVRRLLATREDVFPDYDEDGFREAFGRRWEVASRAPIDHSDRVMYRLTRR